MNKTKSTILALAALFAAVVPHARASVTVYTSQAAFIAALQSGSYTEGFSSTTVGPTSFSFSGGSSLGLPYKYTATTTPVTYFYPYVPNGYSSGQVLSTGDSNQQIVFTIATGSAPVYAMGGNFFDADVNGSLASTLTEVQIAGSPAVNIPSASFTAFVGFISTTPITSLTAFENPSSNMFVNVDNLIVGTPLVPEPSTWALLGVGAGVLGCVTLRRSRRSRAA